MPDYTVELAFTYKRTYRVTADTEEQAIDAAEAADTVEYDGGTVPEHLKDVVALAETDREFAEFEESRIFNDHGEEILLGSHAVRRASRGRKGPRP